MSIGIWQRALILVIVLLVFGAGKLPRVMGDFAKGIKSFKAGMKEGHTEHAEAAAAKSEPDAKVINQEAAAVDATAVKKDEAAKT